MNYPPLPPSVLCSQCNHTLIGSTIIPLRGKQVLYISGSPGGVAVATLIDGRWQCWWCLRKKVRP